MLDFLFTKLSYFGIVAVLVLTGCGLPIPEEVPIVLAGILSAQGTMDVRLAFAACVFGAILGDCVMYAIGYHWGHNLLKDHPRFARFLHAEREARFEEVIQNHGFKVMLLARFMVGIRSPVYLAAGIVRIPFRRFLLIDLFCATLVISVFFSLSYFFGQQVVDYVRTFEIWLTIALIALILAVCYFYWRRRTRIVERVVGPATTDPESTGPAGDDSNDEPRRQEKTVA